MPTSCRPLPMNFGWRLVWIQALLVWGMSCSWPQSVCAETYDNQLPAELSGMGVTEHLADQIPLETTFRDESGKVVKLAQFFATGRPVILSFNYSNCPMLCSLQLSGLVTGLKDVELTCGKDYEFVSISIDPHEQPMRAAQTRQRYYQMYGREGSGNGWHFLVGSQKAITQLTEAIGVTYRYLPDKKEYVHPAVCVAMTPEGRLSRYLYGVTFDPQTLRLALVESSAGKIGTTLDQILLFCFHYDNQAGRYSLSARRLMTAAGLFTTVLLISVLGRMFWKESRLRRRLKNELLANVSPTGTLPLFTKVEPDH